VPRHPAPQARRAAKPRRLEIIEGLETPQELRAKARQFLASCDTLVTKRDAVGAAGAKSLQGSPEGREESGLGISRPERLENRGPTRFNEASLQEPLRAFDVGSR
jgi:hypothetical protein